LDVKLEKEAEDAAHERKLKQAEFDFKKESLKDPTMQKLKQLEAVKQVYSNLTLNGMEFNQMGEGDPVHNLLNRFVSIAVPSDKKAE